MRLGAAIFEPYNDPEQWVQVVQRAGYGAAYCPLKPGADGASIRAYEAAAKKANIVIAEVGAWSNPLAPNEEERRAALRKCQESLALADAIGARCCVNIAGSCGAKWDGPDERDLTEETFAMIVESVRWIIDAVKPLRTYYSLELMPWMYPDSPDSNLRLLRAIDRDRLAVHLDPVNIVSSPQLYFRNGSLIKECFAKLGPWIKSCHAKDILLQTRLTTHLDEVRPGLGKLDYAVYLRELARLDGDVPLIIEHLAQEEDVQLAAVYIRSVAEREGLAFQG